MAPKGKIPSGRTPVGPAPGRAWGIPTGITCGHDLMLTMPYRKLPHRVPRVLTVAEIERLIDAAKTPLERATVQVLYSTGVRVSELT